MYNFLLALLLLDGILLCVVILLQSGKGGGLAAMGGGVTATEGVLGGRQATTVLTRATWIMGGTFMTLAFILSIMSSRAAQPTSILREAPPVLAPEPLIPGEATGTEGTGTVPPPSDPSGGSDSGVDGETGSN